MRPLQTAATTTLAVLGAGALLTGCGGSSAVPSLNMKGPITKAEATAYANAVNRGVADVPRHMTDVSEPTREHAGRGHVCGMAEGARRHALLKIASASFSTGFEDALHLEEVSSAVEVFATASLADHKFAQEKAELWAARACLGRVDAQALDGPNLHVTSTPTVSSLNAPVPRSFGTRTVMAFTVAREGHRYASRIYADNVGFVVGPAEIRFLSMSVGHPLPAATERRLLTLLYNRAKS